MATLNDFQAVRQKLARLYNEKQFAEAAEMLERETGAYPEQLARISFWRVCLLSLCQRSQDALDTLEEGLKLDLWWHHSQFLDSDFDAIRELPRFKTLVERSQAQFEAALGQTKSERAVLVPHCEGSYPLLIAIHGHGGDKSANLDYWEAARQAGWLVLSLQSAQPLFPGAYCWDDPVAGMQDIQFQVDEVLGAYPVDCERIVFGGFSQGSGMAILTALQPKFRAKGFIGVGTWWPDVESIIKAAAAYSSIRGYFITGLKDHTLERSREIQAALRAHNIAFEEETHAEIGHEFPSNFSQSFDQALKFVLRS